MSLPASIATVSRAAASGSKLAIALLACCVLGILACGTGALAQGPPIEPTRTVAAELRLGEEVVPFPAGTVNVPIHVKPGAKTDGVRVSIDFDPSLLGYAWYRSAGPRWRVERVSPYGPSRIGIVLRLNADVAPPAVGMEEIALYAVFYLQSGVAAATEFRAVSALSLGATDNGHGLESYCFSRGTDGTDRPQRTLVSDGSVTIYYRDGVEVDGGALTQRPQEFRLPVYLTSMGQTIRPEDGARTLTIGVDYDEIFLGLVDVRPRSPPAVLGPEELIDDPASGRARLQLTLESSVPNVFARLHVADLILFYYGAASPQALLEVKCAILPDGELPGNAGENPVQDEHKDGVGGAGADTPLEAPALIGFLPPYFVRGNADSSGAPDAQGGFAVTGDLLDARIILEAIFLGRARPDCEDAADASDDGSIGIEDAILLLNHLFRGGPPPAAPYPLPGRDGRSLEGSALDDDGLGCQKPLPHFAPAASR